MRGKRLGIPAVSDSEWNSPDDDGCVRVERLWKPRHDLDSVRDGPVQPVDHTQLRFRQSQLGSGLKLFTILVQQRLMHQRCVLSTGVGRALAEWIVRAFGDGDQR